MKVLLTNTLFLLQFVLYCNCSLLKWEYNDSNVYSKTQRLLGKDKIPEYLQNFAEIIKTGLATANGNVKDQPDITVEVPDGIDREFEIKVKKEETQVGTIIGKEDKESNNQQAIEIIFRNAVDESTLNMSKIDPNDEKQNLLDKYIVPYLTHCKEIIKEKEQVKQIIEHEIDVVKEEIQKLNGGIEKSYQKLFEIESVEKASDEQDGLMLTYILKDGEKEYKYKVKILTEQAEKEGKGDDEEEKSVDTIVKFRSPFFSSQFAVTVPTKSFIERKTKNILLHISKNFSRMFVFIVNPELGDDGENDDEPEFQCENVYEKLEGLNIVDFKLKFENKDEGLLDVVPVDEDNNEKEACPEDGKEFKIECQEAKSVDESNDVLGDLTHDIIYVKITVDNKQFVQTFTRKSLYSMGPVAEAFFEEVGDYAGRTFCPQVQDQAKAFEDDPEADNNNRR